MAIKRYYASKDNTITNAYKSNLTTRGVSGNMGQSDILETFHIYGQQNSASSENSRILIEFDIEDVASDRTSGKIPASGSVEFFLRLYNAEHSQTTPKNFNLVVSALSQSWLEGNGLDMENYSDLDESNWKYRTDEKTAATAIVNFTIDPGLGVNDYLFLNGASKNYIFTSSADSTPIENAWYVGGNYTQAADNLAAIINTSCSNDFTAVATSEGAMATSFVTITAVEKGLVGNQYALTSSDETFFTITGSKEGADALFIDGDDGLWTNEGADFITSFSSSFTASFDTGFEDMDLNVTPLVEQWINSDGNVLGALDNYGVGVRLKSSLEEATTSYYTKRFFARGSQFFFKRPVLEARWDNTKKDNRGNFYLSSSLVPADDNLMKLYLYNVVRGQLTDIPTVGTGDLWVSIYSGTVDTAGSKIGLPTGGGVKNNNDFNITGSWVETGIYSCSFAYTSSVTNIFDVWHTASVQYHTGSAISVITYDSSDYNFDQKYVSNVTNLRAKYSTGEEVRIRLYVREKDWSPTIYSVASKNIETSIIDDAYYKITRVSDNLEVIPFGTGSLNHTRLSYDKNGSYFDMSMDLFDVDTVYELSFAYLINGNYVEQPERFRFRVE